MTTIITLAPAARILDLILSSKLSTTATTLIGTFIFIRLIKQLKSRRKSLIPPTNERVLILGATSGIGRSIARQFAERGASVCVVGRRENLVEEVSAKCAQLQDTHSTSNTNDGTGRRKSLGVCADISDAEGLVRIREVIEREWSGLDTLIIAAGVSALLPLMEVAQVTHSTGMHPDTSQASAKAGIQRAKEVAYEVVKGNYIGPLIAAVTFIPLLQKTSPSPCILLISSLAAVIPAPTRTLYSSTKSASLMLFRALSIEHPCITFSLVLPSTVEGDFRSSAVDGGEKNVREKDPNKYGLKRDDVARRCIHVVDMRERMVFIPGVMRVAMWVYWWCPGLIEAFAKKKYKFNV